MAKKPKKTEVTHEHAIGTRFKFTGYSEDIEDKLLTVGEEVVITAFNEEAESYMVQNEAGIEDTAYADQELELLSDDEQDVSEEDETEAAEAEDGDADEAVAEESEVEEAPKPAKKAAAKKAPAKKAAAKEAEPAEEKTKPAAKKAAAKKAPAKKAAAKKAAKKAPAKEETKIEIVDTEAVSEIMAEAGDAISAAKMLDARAHETNYTLGGVLAHIQEEGLYKEAGYDGTGGFADFVNTELSIGYRAAAEQIRIYKIMAPLEVDEARLAAIGWTKVREIINVVTAENVEEKLDFAENHTRDEVIEHVKTEKVVGKKGTRKVTSEGEKGKTATKVTFKFEAFEENGTLIQNALESALKGTDGGNLNDAFIKIVTEWATFQDNSEMSVEDFLAYGEEKFGVELGVVEEVEEDEAEEA